MALRPDERALRRAPMFLSEAAAAAAVAAPALLAMAAAQWLDRVSLAAAAGAGAGLVASGALRGAVRRALAPTLASLWATLDSARPPKGAASDEPFSSRPGDELAEFVRRLAEVVGRLRESARAARSEADALRSLAAAYLSDELAARIESGSVPIRPERRMAAVLFADLRGFTAALERLPAEAPARVLTDWYAFVEQATRRHGGIVDKFVGDSVLCLFGVPDWADGASASALEAADEMVRSFGELRARWALEWPALDNIGVACGLHVGRVVTGDFGAASRLEHTAVGDVVNVAARLAAMAAPGMTLTPESAYYRLGRNVEPLDRRVLTLKGKEQPVPVVSIRVRR